MEEQTVGLEQFSIEKDDASIQCNNIGLETVMDYSSEFITHEIFKSREALIRWAREVGKKNGFVVIIKTSDTGSKGRTPRITLGCERSGNYREKRKNKEVHEEKKLKLSGSKKCGCPFKLKGQKLAANDEWTLHVLCGVHNHPAIEHLQGHSYAGRLSKEENSLLVNLSRSMMGPKEILLTLKQRDALNASTIKTIYNARHKYKVSEKAGIPQTQEFLGMENSETTHSSENSVSAKREQVQLNIAPMKPHILLAASGSVAAIKFGNLCHCFSEWAEVRAVATKASLHFIDRASLPKDVILHTDDDEWAIWTKIGDSVLHVDLRRWADVMVIAPLSANTLGKIAGGLCDDLLTCIVRAWDYNKPLFVAPAMNTLMWNNPFTDKHLKSIDELGISLIPPVTKQLACGDYGNGAMAEPSLIFSTVRASLESQSKSLESLSKSGGSSNQ